MSSEARCLDEQILAAEEHLAALKQLRSTATADKASSPPPSTFGVASLTKDDVERYSRQMLCEDLGPTGTRRLRDSTVLVVGAGGLGSTVCLYLAAAGVGKLKIMDFDVVDTSNLHRQIIHTQGRVGELKVDSARRSCLALNPHITVVAINEQLNARNAEHHIAQCDVVVDASDNVASRYLINDAAVLCGKPLVSGAAMRWEGQLTVYDRGATTPCYRCLYPVPPPAGAVGSCNDTGVVGPVPGMIGCLQALEAIKLVAQCGEPLRGRMLLWNGLTGMFKTIKLRPRQPSCIVCSTSDNIGDARIQKCLWEAQRPEYDMVPCMAPAFDLPAKNSVTAEDAVASGVLSHGRTSRVVIDVRDALQHTMCNIDGSISLPLREIAACTEPLERLAVLKRALRFKRGREEGASSSVAVAPAGEEEVYVICRRGIASTTAVKLLLEAQAAAASSHDAFEGSEFSRVTFKSVAGGLNRYSSQCDHNFPNY